MAILSDTPYGAFNFQVSLGGTDPSDIRAGFSDISGLSMEIQVVEYRAGNYLSESPIKIPGLTKYPAVTLKRGLIGALDLFEWIEESAQSGAGSRRDVTIHLIGEERQPVMTWKLRNAWISKYSFSDLNASSNEVAIEAIELQHEGLEIE